MPTFARGLRFPEPAPAAGQAGKRHGWPLPEVEKSRYFALFAQNATFVHSGLILAIRELGRQISSRPVRTPEPVPAACRAVARRGRSLARVAKWTHFAHHGNSTEGYGGPR